MKFSPEALECPQCHADWRAGQIPPESVSNGWYGHRAPCGKLREWDEGYDKDYPCECGPRYFSRLCGIQLSYTDPRHYDGVSFWVCPDCDFTWDRFAGKQVPREDIDNPSPVG